MRWKKKARHTKQVQENNFLESFPSINLLGQPGYRNSYGKSGLGYFETQTEMARMQGLFICWLVTGNFRTRNPFYLIFMFFVGFFYGVVPLAAIIVELYISKNYQMIGLLLVILPNIAFGIALLANCLLSIIDPGGKSITGD